MVSHNWLAGGIFLTSSIWNCGWPRPYSSRGVISLIVPFLFLFLFSKVSMFDILTYCWFILAVLGFWFNIDNWGHDRCYSKWQNSWLHWSKRCKFFPFPCNYLQNILSFLTRNLILLSSNLFNLHLCSEQSMGISDIFCIVGWLFIVFSKVLSPISYSKICLYTTIEEY